MNTAYLSSPKAWADSTSSHMQQDVFISVPLPRKSTLYLMSQCSFVKSATETWFQQTGSNYLPHEHTKKSCCSLRLSNLQYCETRNHKVLQWLGVNLHTVVAHQHTETLRDVLSASRRGRVACMILVQKRSGQKAKYVLGTT